MQQPKTRMTFRFEPPKPKAKEQTVRPVPPTQAPEEGVDPYDALASHDRNEGTSERGTKAQGGGNAELPPAAYIVDRDASGTDVGNEAYPRQIVAWDSPYQDDIRALEEMIRKTERPKETVAPAALFRKPTVKAVRDAAKPAAAADDAEPATGIDLSEVEASEAARERKRNGSFEGAGVAAFESSSWYARIREGNDSGAGEGADPERDPARGGGPSWGRVFVSVAAAIATGALFGYLALSLFTGEPLFPGKSSGDVPVSGSGTAEILPSQAAETFSKYPVVSSSPDSSSDGQETDRSAGTVTLAASPAYLLQFGKFQNIESMQEAVKQLKEKGYVYATDASDGYRVFAGVATTQSDAQRLSARLTDAELYVKPFGGEALDVSSAVLSPEGAEYLNASSAYTKQLIEFTQRELSTNGANEPGQDVADKLAEGERLWRQTSASSDKVGAARSTDAKAIAQALNAASLTLSDYAREPSRARLWSVQAQAMKALLADHRIRAALSESTDG
ncbi:SPOR domain-containing protein [Cohnella suwonensis]|uniref:SPOR domain-containing protein n=1 Tax=Cohnella suwonensis TaxID=696072 RepID=A0ABW0LQY7_9BACL